MGAIGRFPPDPAELLARIKGILVDPKAEWPKIEGEPATIAGIYSGYVVILAAVSMICTFISSLIYGVGAFGLTYYPSFLEALTTALWQFALQLGVVAILALIIETLAPTFGGQKDRLSAFKLAAYSATAGWLANVFTLVPGLSFLVILGVYSLYSLYTGLPVLMKVPQEKAVRFLATLVIINIVVAVVFVTIWTAFSPNGSDVGQSPAEQKGSLSGQLTLPGGGSVDLGKLEQAAKRIESMSKGDSTSETVIAADDLKALLPKALAAGFTRGEVSASSGGAANVTIAEAKAVYTKDDRSLSLSVTDMGIAGAFAALSGAFGANATQETENSYSRVAKVDGRMTMEDFNRETKAGTFSVLVAERVMVKAEGTGASIEELKSAVGSVDVGRIEALAKN